MTEQNSSKPVYPIVGIGASAGGLDAIQRFLAKLPQDFGFAIVFIQHLSAKHKSLLHELLSARRPSLVIQQISDGLKIQPGRLYLAPPGREVRLQNGLFQTTAHPEGLIHLPIDEFLSSLAEDAAERSIAVILSGAGTDGARGCRTIRSAGGTVYVQDPETAEFDSMPLAAIATGHADAVLSPEVIAAELLKLHGIGQVAASREVLLAPAEYDAFFSALQEKAGSRFNHFKKSVVGRRIRRRMQLHGLSSVKDYLDLLLSSDSEAEHLAADLMIGVTSFFRDRVAWKALNLEAVRKITAGNDDLPIRVWTPATATGEEAYSIAMILLHELVLSGKRRDVHVFATDVNERALGRAREGRYPASVTADVTQEYIRKYFTPTDDGNCLTINKDVRECVIFARQDLLTDPPFSKLDLIICRNFLIYLEPEAQEKSIQLFHYALNDGGFLFLGNAETVGRKSGLFKSIGHKQCRIYQKLESKPASRLPISVPYAAERRTFSSKPENLKREPSAIVSIQEKLLEEYGPTAVAIDQNYEIIYHNGPTNQYLSQPRGAPTRNLLELLPENLRSRVRGALYRSGREERPVVIRTSVAEDDNKTRRMLLRITKASENLYIVVFQEKAAPAKKEISEQVDAAVIEESAIHQLESELSATRADLQSNIEQLRSMNEEFQSSNEELQAANEELETSREELQSLNEELITVNSQLQGKIEEQDVTNNDLNNFQASTNIPMLFLDMHFRVKRFTPAMLRLIKLLPSDVGRPIVDMSQENLGPDLIPCAEVVLEQLVSVKRELELGKTWYVRTTLPYRTTDNRIEGVVITYNDVTELKRAEERTRHLASFPQLNPNPVIEVDASGRVIFANPATENILESLGLDKGEVSVLLPADLDVILKELDKKGEYTVSRVVPVKDRVYSATVHLVPQFSVLRIYAYDITNRKRAEEALKKSEELFRLALDNIPDAVGIYDAERKYKFVNAEGLRRLGKPLEDLVGRPLEELYDEEARSAYWPSLIRAYETGEPQTVECAVSMPTGTYDFIIKFIPMLKDGRIYQVLNFSFDITERKKAEEAQGRLAALVDSADDAIISKDLNGVVQSWNVGAEKIFGYTAAEAVGRNISFLVPPGHVDEVPGIIKRIVQGEHIEHFESVRMRNDGTIVPVSLTYSAIKDANGKIIGVSKIAHDITAHKQAEEALRGSEARYRGLFENMIEGFAYCKMIFENGKPLDFVYLSVNHAFETLTGLKNVVGKRVTEVIPGIREADQELFEIYGRVSLTGKSERFETFVEALKMWFSISVYSPEKEFFVAVFDVITERKKVEADVLKLSEDMAARNAELESANKEMESFIYSISHDLRAPIRTMSGFAKILYENYAGKLDAQGQDYLDRILKGSAKSTLLIDDLLHLSKISRQEVDRIVVNLSNKVSKLAHELRQANQGRNVEVVVQEGLIASADPRLIELALSNLLENAWKFTSKTEKAKIEFGSIARDGNTVYFIRDNGAGFDMTYAGKMFWPFHRLHTEKEFEGTGIGLTIVERVIQRHGGKVWAEGAVGKGAVFYFTL
jgi:two-component system CheB/CheR fusion protein